jgi:hypothetical protein
MSREPPDDLRLGSLADGRIDGLAFRYTLILPLFSERSGAEIFSLDDASAVVELLVKRFGGCTVSPVSRGTWMPESQRRLEADRIIQVYVYARQQEGVVDQFFQELKFRLKQFGKQEEVVIERAEVWLLAARAPSKKQEVP